MQCLHHRTQSSFGPGITYCVLQKSAVLKYLHAGEMDSNLQVGVHGYPTWRSTCSVLQRILKSNT